MTQRDSEEKEEQKRNLVQERERQRKSITPLAPTENNGLIKTVVVKFMDFYNLLKSRPLGPITGHFY